MSTGVRVSNIPAKCSEKEIKIHFTKPDNGGGPIKEIYYPLHQGDAVVIYKQPETADKVLQSDHTMKGETLDVNPIPAPQAFTAVEATFDPTVAALIQSTEDVRDELQYVKNIDLCKNESGTITGVRGNWYLLEWVSAYIERIAKRQHNVRRHRYAARDDMVNETRCTSPMQLEDHIVSLTHTPETMPEIKDISTTVGGANVTDTSPVEEEIETQKETSRDEKVGQIERNSSPREEGERTGSLDDNESLVKLTNLKISESEEIPGDITVLSGNTDDIKSLDFRYGPLTISVYTGYITMAETDAIVNAANASLEHIGGVAGAIAEAAGYEMRRQCEEYRYKAGTLRTTHIMHTCAGGKISLKVKYIMHAVGPIYSAFSHTKCALQLTQTFLNCMKYGNDVLKVQSVAMPVISSGIFGCPLEVCVRSFFDAVLLFACEHMADPVHLKEVHLVNNNGDNTAMTVLQLKELISQGTQKMVLEAQRQLLNTNAADIDYTSGVTDKRFDLDQKPTTIQSRYSFTSSPEGKVYDTGRLSGLNRTSGTALSGSSRSSTGWTAGSSVIDRNASTRAGTCSASYDDCRSPVASRTDHSVFTMGSKTYRFETNTTDWSHTRSIYGSGIKSFSTSPDQASSTSAVFKDTFSNQRGARNDITSGGRSSGPPTTSYMYSGYSKLPRGAVNTSDSPVLAPRSRERPPRLPPRNY